MDAVAQTGVVEQMNVTQPIDSIQSLGAATQLGGMSQMGFWDMISNATVVVQGVMGLLAIMSLISWSIIFYKIIQINIGRRKALRERAMFQNATNLADGVQTLREQGNSALYPIAKRGLQEFRRLEQSVIHPNLKFRVAGDNLRRVLEQGVSEGLGEMSRSLSFFGDMRQCGPVYRAFRNRLGHHEFVSCHRPDEDGGVGCGRSRHLRGSGGHRHRPGRGHSGDHRLQHLSGHDHHRAYGDGVLCQRISESRPA